MNLDALIPYAIKLLEPIEKTKYYYHNVYHTLDVFNSIANYAAIEKINGEDLVLLKTAAIFHDIGIIFSYQNHEEESVRIAEEVLPEYDFFPKQIQKVASLIMATKIPTQPRNKMEKLICDADLDYLGRDDYFEISDRLRREWAACQIIHYTDKDWHSYQLGFLKEHNYYSLSARLLRNKGKVKNIKKIKELIK